MKQLCIKHNINNKVIRYSQVRNEYRCSYHHCRFLGNVLWARPENQCRWSCKSSSTRLWLSGLGERDPRIITSHMLFQFSVTYITLAKLSQKPTEMDSKYFPLKGKKTWQMYKAATSKDKMGSLLPHKCPPRWYKIPSS